MKPSLIVLDDFFPNFDEVRQFALSHDFNQAPKFVDGHQYPRHVEIQDTLFKGYVANLLTLGLNFGGVNIRHAAFVSAVKGFKAQQWIHTDNICAQFAAVCHLHDIPGTGTMFFEHRHYGHNMVPPVSEEMAAQLRDDGNKENAPVWRTTDYAASRRNRLYMFPTDRFHARWPRFTDVEEVEHARLTMVLFFDVH